MKKEKLEVVRGSGNIFRDFGDADADVKQLKVILAAEIIKKLDRCERTRAAGYGDLEATVDRFRDDIRLQGHLIHVDEVLAQRFEIHL